MRFDVHPTMMKQKQGAPPKTTDDNDMYNRAFPVGNALFFFTGGVMSLFHAANSCWPSSLFQQARMAG